MTRCTSPSSTPPATTSSSGSRSTHPAGALDARAGRGAVRPAPRHRRRRPDHDRPGTRRRRLHDDARRTPTAARAEMSGNGIRCLAWVAARAGLGAGRRARSSTPRRAGAVVHARARPAARSSAPRSTWARSRSNPRASPSTVDDPFELEAVADGVRYRGDAAGMGNPHLVLFVDDPATVPRHDARARASSTTPGSRAARTSSSCAVDRTPTGSRCGSGNAGVGRDAVVRHRRVRGRRGRAPARARRRRACRSTCPAARSTVDARRRPCGSAARSCTCSTSSVAASNALASDAP